MPALKIFEVSDNNKQLIDKYIEMREAKGKSKTTLMGEINNLEKLGNFLGNKNFKDTTEKDLQDFFTGIKSLTSKDLYAIRIIQFYRWLFELKKKQRPELMDWYEFATVKQKRRQRDPNKKKYLMTSKEYQKLIDASADRFGMWQALWEIYYLSGARENEIVQMKIKDVKFEGTNVIIVVTDSKTDPRNIPLPAKPNLLIRWLNNHPLKKDTDAPLWISMAPRSYMKQLSPKSVYSKFILLRDLTGIKKTLNVHCFRKTRATIIFNSDLSGDDKLIGMFFGWTPETVAQRREEYDLRGEEELKQKVFATSTGKLETYDSLKADNKLLESKYNNEIEEMKGEIGILKEIIKDLHGSLKKMDERYMKLIDKLG